MTRLDFPKHLKEASNVVSVHREGTFCAKKVPPDPPSKNGNNCPSMRTHCRSTMAGPYEPRALKILLEVRLRPFNQPMEALAKVFFVGSGMADKVASRARL